MKPYILTGEAAAEFARALFRPTREEIEARNKILDEIDRNVIIQDILHGFEAEFPDDWIDLSRVIGTGD